MAVRFGCVCACDPSPSLLGYAGAALSTLCDPRCSLGWTSSRSRLSGFDCSGPSGLRLQCDVVACLIIYHHQLYDIRGTMKKMLGADMDAHVLPLIPLLLFPFLPLQA